MSEAANVPPPDPSTPWTGAVAVTAAILAALAAVSSMLSQRHTTEAMIDQIEASDQWNFFQAKGIKLALTENKIELLPSLGKEVSVEDQSKVKRYHDEQLEIKNHADEKQNSASDHRRRSGIISNAATLSQIAIALAAISLLTKKKWFWYLAMLTGIGGAIFLGQGLFFPFKL